MMDIDRLLRVCTGNSGGNVGDERMMKLGL
jgi:hypothetical protein